MSKTSSVKRSPRFQLTSEMIINLTNLTEKEIYKLALTVPELGRSNIGVNSGSGFIPLLAATYFHETLVSEEGRKLLDLATSGEIYELLKAGNRLTQDGQQMKEYVGVVLNDTSGTGIQSDTIITSIFESESDVISDRRQKNKLFRKTPSLLDKVCKRILKSKFAQKEVTVTTRSSISEKSLREQIKAEVLSELRAEMTALQNAPRAQKSVRDVLKEVVRRFENGEIPESHRSDVEFAKSAQRMINNNQIPSEEQLKVFVNIASKNYNN